MRQYTGVDLAPYYRFRPTAFYDTVFPNGTYTADIVGCNWTCEHCWSKYGWRGLDLEAMPKGSGEFTSEQVVTKLVKGMERSNLQPMCRISGGEASMYWDPHMVGVIRHVLGMTEGRRMQIRGVTEPGVGAAMGICIETNGSVLTVAQLNALEEEFGEDARRIVLAIGMKATNAGELARLTGMTTATAERFHKGQMRTLRHLALKAKHLGWFANYIDEFTDDVEYARLVRDLERKRPGSARLMGVDPYHRSYQSNRHYTPKRMQA
jgi:uncharacterized Fe-S cluster-containing radical SAM superfamily protein